MPEIIEDPTRSDPYYIICPYCDEQHYDASEYEAGDHVLECNGCGREFRLSVVISIDYNTERIDAMAALPAGD